MRLMQNGKMQVYTINTC